MARASESPGTLTLFHVTPRAAISSSMARWAAASKASSAGSASPGVKATSMVARHVGYEGAITWDTSKPNGQPRRLLDVSRARERFGFEAEISFEEGVQLTVEWWLAHRDDADGAAR